ncbi:hypothetical protein B879_02384 [Cecembia lonarensis LW9]|uniref:Uncharacterized protein n=1 Tax=Cecembia lonarensis (strain CCUG 58316 / KCTC 22772 / LW9) TaxID=1225176 RepID=K1KXV9_CECL9|nr:hypothetical protein B879_02384 [Cecembia lonarensis LW9]
MSKIHMSYDGTEGEILKIKINLLNIFSSVDV